MRDSDALGRYLADIGRYRLLTSAEEVELAQQIEAGEEARRCLEAGRPKRRQRARLEEQVRAGEAARDRFVKANLRLVVANARRHVSSGGLELFDLIQEGALGLERAVEKFDWRKGFRFSTYATWWIRQAIRRAVATKTRTVRVPAGLTRLIPLIEETRARLVGRLGRLPNSEEIAAEAGLPVDRVRAALEVPSTVSLDVPVGEGETPLGELLVTSDEPDPSEEAERRDSSERVHAAVARLPERERRIIELRYGFDDGRPLSYRSIGDQLGLTGERVRQLERQARKRLRRDTKGLSLPSRA